MLFFWRMAIAGADAVDAIDVRLLHPLEKLARVGRQRLDVAPLPFGVDRVEGERRLARPADAGDDDQLAGGQRDVDVLEVVRARAADDEIRGFGSPRGNSLGHARDTTCESPAQTPDVLMEKFSGSEPPIVTQRYGTEQPRHQSCANDALSPA